MANQYLDKFRSTVRESQSKQILKILNSKKQAGKIRSAQDFQQRLADLMQELAGRITPVLKLFPAEEDGFISSEQYNDMLEKVEYDLETAFTEANNIAEIQGFHEELVSNLILKKIKSALNELSGKISMYEYLANNKKGFDTGQFNTFKEEKDSRSLRGGTNVSLFIDPRLKSFIKSEYDAAVDVIGERLTLPYSSKTYHHAIDIEQIHDSEAPLSVKNVQPRALKLENIIDGQLGTYWIQSVLTNSQEDEIKAKIEIDYGNVKEINFLEIEPATKHPFYLEKVQYLDIDKVYQDLPIDEVYLVERKLLTFKKVATRKLLFTFRQVNFNRIQFQYDADAEDSLQEQIETKASEFINRGIVDVADTLESIISSADIREAIAVPNVTLTTFDGYEYVIGLDNIRVGNAIYNTKGFFLSSPLKITDAGELGLTTTETRPYWETDITDIQTVSAGYDLASVTTDLLGTAKFDSPDDVYLAGSIEYWIYKQDYRAGNLIKTTIFPIMPLDKERIHHERLLLTEKSSSTNAFNDIGQTIFYTNSTSTEGNLKVYKNGFELTEVIDWAIVEALNTPGDANAMVSKIQIYNISVSDIFTVSYNPLESTTNSIPKDISDYSSYAGLQLIDMVGDLSVRLGDGKKIIFYNKELGIESYIYLGVILRQNTSNPSLTPAIEEYTLLAGSEDITKFEGL